MKDSHKKELLKIILKHFPNAKVYLFGSRARKNQKEGSDVDLAIDIGEKIDFDAILHLKSVIEETTIPFFVDIVDMHSAPDTLKEEIIKDRVIWTD